MVELVNTAGLTKFALEEGGCVGMRRILVMLTVVSLMVVMLVMSVASAFARGCPLEINHPAYGASDGRCIHIPSK